jgi:hypothetical protein
MLSDKWWYSIAKWNMTFSLHRLLIIHSYGTFEAILSRIQLRKYSENKNLKPLRKVVQASQFDILLIFRLIKDAVSM